MGEEFAASTPFLFFCDFGADLAQAVLNGRRDEFKRFAAFADPTARARIPDPNAESTFVASRLRWEERESSPHRERLALVRKLLALRRHHLTPLLKGVAHGGHHAVDGSLLRVDWPLGDASSWHLLVNFGSDDIYTTVPLTGNIIHAHGLHDAAPAMLRLEPGAAVVTVTSNVLAGA
jgi:maltooligosyltrehalose trehalohydrolase